MKPSILITGASGGIGQSLVAKLADHFQIYATGRKSERLRSFPETVRTLSGDLSSETFRAELAEWANGVTAIIHNAGYAPNISVEETDSDFDRQVFEINAIAPLDLTRKLQRSLGQGSPGRVISISSFATHDPFPGFRAYAASKSALESLVRSLPGETDGQVIGFNVALAAVETPALRAFADEAMVPPEAALAPDAVAMAVTRLLRGDFDDRSGERFLLSVSHALPD